MVTKLKVTYNATYTELPRGPQVQFYYDESNYVAIRLPIVNLTVIKWKWPHEDDLLPGDANLSEIETWTFEVAPTGTVTLTSPREISYSRSINKTEVPEFPGKTLTLGFDDFKFGDMVSCYEIVNKSPSTYSKKIFEI